MNLKTLFFTAPLVAPTPLNPFPYSLINKVIREVGGVHYLLLRLYNWKNKVKIRLMKNLCEPLCLSAFLGKPSGRADRWQKKSLKIRVTLNSFQDCGQKTIINK